MTMVRTEAALDDVRVDEPAVPAYVRTWSDAVRVAFAFVVMAIGLVATRYAGEGIRAVEQDALRLIENLASSVQSFVVAVLQTTAAYAPLVAVVVLLALRQWRRLGLLFLAVVTASLLMRLTDLLAGAPAAPRPAFPRLGPGFATGTAFPSPAYVAAATAIVVTQWPWLASTWRRITVAGLVLAGVARLAAGTSRDVPPDLLLSYAVGWFAGLLLLLVTGRPNHRVRASDIATAMARAATPLRSITAVGQRAEGTRIYRAETRDGEQLAIKVRQGGERMLDGAAKLYRNLRLRQPVGEHPFWSPQRSAEHEALVAVTARRRGAPALDVVAALAVGPDRRSSIIASVWLPGAQILSDVADERWSDPSWSDPVLLSAWQGLAQLRAAGVAHRNLQLRNLLWDGRQVSFLDFDLAEAAADPVLLTDDVVELLCATAARVGPERAVHAAGAVLDKEEIVEAVPRLQPLVLSFPTRSEVRRSPKLLDSLRTQLSQLEDVDELPLAQLERLKPRTVLIVVMSALALYFVVPEIARYSETFQVDELARADLGWVAGALLASAASYVASAVGLWGAVPNRISVLSLTTAQVACQFANFATPAQVGGMAVNARFLQKRGTDPPVAVAAIGLNLATAAVCHVALLGVFVYWAGTLDSTTIELPTTTILVVLAVAAVVGLLTMSIPVGRRFVMGRLVPVLGRAMAGLRDVSRRPGKLAALVGGSLLLSATYIAALACSVEAFGGDVPLVSIGVVFLGSSVVAAAAPTPGGLGAIELSIVGGLTGVGVDPGVALYSTLVYRLATFWVPLVPGWATFTWLQHRGSL